MLRVDGILIGPFFRSKMGLGNNRFFSGIGTMWKQNPNLPDPITLRGLADDPVAFTSLVVC